MLRLPRKIRPAPAPAMTPPIRNAARLGGSRPGGRDHEAEADDRGPRTDGDHALRGPPDRRDLGDQPGREGHGDREPGERRRVMVKRTGEERDCEPGEQPENREADEPSGDRGDELTAPLGRHLESLRAVRGTGRGGRPTLDRGGNPQERDHETDGEDDVRQRERIRCVLRQDAGDQRTDRQPADVRDRRDQPGPARRSACGVDVEIGEVGGSGRDARPQRDAGQDPAGDDGAERLSRDEHHHRGDRDHEAGDQHGAPPVPVGDVADQQQTRDETDHVHPVDDRGRQRRERVAMRVQPVQRAGRGRQRRYGQEGVGNGPERCSPRELRREFAAG